MKIGVFVVTWNEQRLLPDFVAHYRHRFGDDVTFHVRDNESTDATRAIARSLGCKVSVFRTDGLRDDVNAHIKSTAWMRFRNAYDWVLLCDCDEFIDVTPAFLTRASKRGYTVIETKGYDMVGESPSVVIADIRRGVRAGGEDKPIVIDPKAIRTCSYAPGAHTCKFEGRVRILRHGCTLRHYKFLNADYVVARYAALRGRRSALNRANTWGGQYEASSEEVLDKYVDMLTRAKPVRSYQNMSRL